MTSTAEAEPMSARALIASRRHTATLVLILTALAAAGAASSRGHPVASGGAPAPPLATLYLSVMVGEWALVYYIWKGTRRTLPRPLRSLVGTARASAGRELAVAAALWAAWVGVEWVAARALPTRTGGVSALLPHGPLQVTLWLLVSASAGFSEELVFRGYLMRQLEALTGRRWTALVLQAALFGVVHGYEGIAACLRIVLFGLLFGAVALWRRDLRACVIAHAWTDIVAGLGGL